jgi:hypothetical protein
MVSITKKVAEEIVKAAATLFAQGAGLPISEEAAAEGGMFPEPGLIDDIHPEDHDLSYWANAILMFLRTVHGVIANAVAEDDIIDEFLDIE